MYYEAHPKISKAVMHSDSLPPPLGALIAAPVVAAVPPVSISRILKNSTPNDTFVSTRRGAEWTYLQYQRITGGISWTPIDERGL